MSSGGFRHISPSVVVFRWPSFDRLSWSSTSLCFAVLSCKLGKICSRPAGHEKPLLGLAATRIQIKVIAIHKFLYAVFKLQIMVRNVYDETPRHSAEVTFTSGVFRMCERRGPRGSGGQSPPEAGAFLLLNA